MMRTWAFFSVAIACATAGANADEGRWNMLWGRDEILLSLAERKP